MFEGLSKNNSILTGKQYSRTIGEARRTIIELSKGERKFTNDEVMASSEVLRTLEALASVPSAGPPAAFSYLHVSSVVLLLGDEGQIGRIRLSKRLGLGQGATRTTIKHLAMAG